MLVELDGVSDPPVCTGPQVQYTGRSSGHFRGLDIATFRWQSLVSGPMSDEIFLTTEELLDYLNINLRTVYRLIKAGELPAVRVGRQWRFRKREIDAWLRDGESASKIGRRREDGSPYHPRILVADDEEAVSDLLAKGLRLAEYEVETAPDGPAALEKLRAEEFDLLITDLKMPGMDGLSLIRESRRLWPHMPIVIITGHSTEACAIEAINIGGVTGYITKPFRLPRILSEAAKALGEPVPASEA